MCGEHTCCVTAKSWAMGSSPHVRGALVTMPGMRSGRGIIPACAGSTRILLHKDDPVWDHPRMCGEHITPKKWTNLVPGSSPHVRGAHDSCSVISALLGIIPACAGSTPPRMTWVSEVWDHPRMCGEHDGVQAILTTDKGSSPHVRGALTFGKARGQPIGIIPACAGSTLR